MLEKELEYLIIALSVGQMRTAAVELDDSYQDPSTFVLFIPSMA